MEKIKFALQVAVLMVAFPLYFYAEISRGESQAKAVKAESKKIDCYTKNGKDKTYKVEVCDDKTPKVVVYPSVYTNTVFINSFN